MVVLVRCFDDTFALALESRLHELKKEGLISAFLRKGAWVNVAPKKRKAGPLVEKRRSARLTATVSCSAATY